MAETTTTRLGLRRWSADADTWSRTEFDANNAARDALVAMFIQATGAPPPAGIAGRFAATLADDSLYYDTGVKRVTVRRESSAVASLLLGGLAYDTNGESGTDAGTPNVFRRGDLVTLIVAIRRPTGATGANANLINVPTGYRPTRPIPMELYSRPDRNYSLATLGTDGNLNVARSFTSGEFIYGTVTYPSL